MNVPSWLSRASLGLVVLLVACHSADSGLSILPCKQSGSPACGTATLGTDSAEVQANSNNILSAKVLVTTHGASKVQVLFQAPGSAVVTTPVTSASDGQQLVLPVLGLEDSASYQFQVLLTAADGSTARSPVMSLATPALPKDIASNFAFHVKQLGEVPPGYIAVSRIQGSPTLTAPMAIVDRYGEVVWYGDPGPQLKGDFQKQDDNTYTASIADPTRTQIYLRYDALGNTLGSYVSPNVSETTDNHELRLLPNGDALLLGLQTRTMDLTAYDGGSSTAVIGNTLYRLQPDGGTAFTWSTFDHVSPADIDPALVTINLNPLDEIHANAIDVTSDGNYLVSSRHMSQVWKIDATTGDLIWKLGRHGDFTFVNDPLNGFSGQHFIREVAPDDVILFDDGDGHSVQASRAVEYKLDVAAKTATLVWSYQPDPVVYSFALGSAQRLSNGDTLVTFGTASRIDEVDANGHLLWQLTDTTPAFGFYRGLFMESLY